MGSAGRGQENLCDQPLFAGYDIDGGYAEYRPICLRCRSSEGGTAAVCGADQLSHLLRRRRAVERLGIYGFGGVPRITQVAVLVMDGE